MRRSGRLVEWKGREAGRFDQPGDAAARAIRPALPVYPDAGRAAPQPAL